MSAEPNPKKKRYFALAMLVLTAACWGLAYPFNTAIQNLQHLLVPGTGTMVVASILLSGLFFSATVMLGLWSARTLRGLTRTEVWHGIGVGVFTGAGLWVLFDAFNYTLASTAAFLAQLWSAMIPVVLAVKTRRLPGRWVALSVAVMVAGVAALSGFDPKTLTLGRGELESMLAAVSFCGLFLWNERPAFAQNNPSHSTFVMAGTVALGLGVVSLLIAPEPSLLWRAFGSVHVVWLGLLITFVWVVLGFSLVVRFQKDVTATETGVILCFEPVFAAICSLFFPGLLSLVPGVQYPNETVTQKLLLGGGLILAANLILQFRPFTVADKQ